jgi:hypothetical protein
VKNVIGLMLGVHNSNGFELNDGFCTFNHFETLGKREASALQSAAVLLAIKTSGELVGGSESTRPSWGCFWIQTGHEQSGVNRPLG